MADLLEGFDRRLIPARKDLAAASLRDRFAAPRYAEGVDHVVTCALLDLTMTPDANAERATQLLCGECFTVYEMDRDDGFAWGQAALDGYVGYVDSSYLSRPTQAQGQSRQVTALWSQIYAAPNVRATTGAELPFFSYVRVAQDTADYAQLSDGGFVPMPHFARVEGDFVSLAEKFLGAPYLWGGRSARGLDCSALVQLAILGHGMSAPRDSDQQWSELGILLADEATPQRGDLVFWKGHVGIMRNADTLLHANAHHMAVASEPLRDALMRIAETDSGPMLGMRRIMPSVP